MTVPDFSGASSRAFEIRTLYFLASWIDAGNTDSKHQLHLACVGEPPASVTRLSKEAGASVTVHEPRRIEGIRSANKFRAFEVRHGTPHLLLVDTDVLFLSKLGELPLPEGCLAAASAFKRRVPEWVWIEVYKAAGMALPEERMQSQASELGCSDIELKGEESDSPMLPYYNSGVIFAPWSAPLAGIWEETIRQVHPRLESLKKTPASVLRSDQTTFTLALRKLQDKGYPLRRLPDRFHGHRLHLYRGKLRWNELCILHFTRSFSERRRSEDPWEWTRLSVKHFRRQLWGEYMNSDLPNHPVRGARRSLGPALGDSRKLERRLGRLYRQFVQPSMEGRTVGGAGAK